MPNPSFLYLPIILDILEEQDIDILVAISAFPQTEADINDGLTIVHFGEFTG